jgi:iron(III) transport system substrate-binding protein
MRISKGFLVGVLAINLLRLQSAAGAAVIDDLVAGAKKEGAIHLHASSDLTPVGAQELAAALNKKYGLAIKVNYFPSQGFAKDIAKVITQTATGAAPEYDLMVLTEDLHAYLAQKKLHLPFNYRALGIDAKAIDHDNGSVALVHQVTLPAYNTKNVAAKDVPTTWDDLLDPKWRDGKLGIFDARYFALLAAGSWGEKKTTEYVRGLARQKPFLGRVSDLFTRLVLGEVLVAVMMADNRIYGAQKTGAPVAFAEKVEPTLLLPFNIGAIKGAVHPNTAHLFGAFMVTPEAQAIWEKYRGQTSAFLPGTRSHTFLRGREVLLMRAQDPALVERLSDEYNKTLGLSR